MKLARDHDEAVRREAIAINTQAGARTAADLATGFRRLATRSLKSALATLKDEAFAAETANDLLALLDVAIRASDAAEALLQARAEPET